jgi:hypothetical protein
MIPSPCSPSHSDYSQSPAPELTLGPEPLTTETIHFPSGEISESPTSDCTEEIANNPGLVADIQLRTRQLDAIDHTEPLRDAKPIPLPRRI